MLCFEKAIYGNLDEARRLARRARKRTGQRIYTYYAAEYGGYQIGHPIGNRRRIGQRRKHRERTNH